MSRLPFIVPARRLLRINLAESVRSKIGCSALVHRLEIQRNNMLTISTVSATFSKSKTGPDVLSVLQSCKFHTSNPYQGVTEDQKTKDIALWSNIKELRRSPVPALTLGLSGLVPFVASPAYMVMNQTYLPSMAFAQLAYGAVILSFIGGMRWGFTLPEDNPVRPDWVNLGYSLLPPLVAWGGLLLPDPISIFTVMGGLTFAGYCDMAMFGYPPWFKGLRFLLTFIGIMSLWTTFMCSFLLAARNESKEEEKKQQ